MQLGAAGAITHLGDRFKPYWWKVDAVVSISVKGGGLTFGKTEIYNGKAEVSGVRSINDIYGSYAGMAAHAGVVKAGAVEVMTKGNVSLALAGTGSGVDIGIDFSGFTISKVGEAKGK